MTARLSLRVILLWIYALVSNNANSFVESNCSPFYLHAHNDYYLNVSLIRFISTLPIRIHSLNNSEEIQELDFDTRIRLPTDYKKFTFNCEKVFVNLYNNCSYLNQVKYQLITNYLKINHRGSWDQFVFIVGSKASQAHIVSAGLFQQFKYCSIVTVGSLQSHKSETKPRRRLNRDHLRGQTIKATVTVVEPYIILASNGKPVGGYMFNILSESAKYYNYTLIVEHPPFKGFIQLPNKTWTGPIGQVVYGETDVLVGVVQTYDRSPYLDFSSCVDVARVYFVTSLPTRKVEWAAVLFIFKPQVWLLLIGVCICLVALFYGFFKLKKPGKSAWAYKAVDLTISPILQKQADRLPRDLEIRALAMLWAFTALVLLIYYKMDFLAYVTFPKEEITPRTFRELSQSDYRIKLHFIRAAESRFFNRTKNPIYARIRNRFDRETNIVTCLSAAAFDPKSACIVWDHISRVHTAKNLTLNAGFWPYLTSRDTPLPSAVTLAFTKESKYSASLSGIAGYFRDTGHTQKWKNEASEIRRKEGRKWLQQEANKDNQIYIRLKTLINSRIGTDLKKLGLENLLIGFFQLLIGSIISGSVFVIENCQVRISNLVEKNQEACVLVEAVTPEVKDNCIAVTLQEENSSSILAGS